MGSAKGPEPFPRSQAASEGKPEASLKVGVLTASDRGARGEREDKSGKVIAELIRGIGGEVAEYAVVPDAKAVIAGKLTEMADTLGLDLILTTGGTGLGPRDVTPEATLEVIERQVPGMAEAMRTASIEKTPHGMLSRAVVGTRGQTLIVNLPGSPVAVRECLEVILPALPHAVQVLKGKVADCARPD